MFICYVMIDIETMGWRGWFLWSLTFLGIYFKKLAIGTALSIESTNTDSNARSIYLAQRRDNYAPL
jgi:hypothetical protein